MRTTCLLLLALPALAAANSTRTEHVTATLLMERAAVSAGDTLWVGLRFDIVPHWHVYWRNPGDSGTAPEIRWRLPEGWSAGEIRWPVPQRIPVGPFVNYGYEDSVTFMVPIRVGPYPGAGPVVLEADARWLVCREQCVPEAGVLRVAVGSGAARPDPEVSAHFDAVRARWPAALPGQARYAVADGHVLLALDGLDWPVDSAADLWFASHAWGPVAPSGAQTWERTPGGLRLQAPAGDLPPDGRAPLTGLLVVSEPARSGRDARGFVLSASPGPVATTPTVAPHPATAPLGLMAALVFAFAGGLILNLMPCVLPVLSIKVLGFVDDAHGERGRLARHGLLFAGGVLVSFLALACLLLALRAGGQALGWGFQLQSPPVVTGLAYVMLLVALSLSGVLRIGTALMGAGQTASAGRGAASAFLSGVLAVVVASPCTAPFMGAALGFALTVPAPTALATFLALGAGFALPVVALSLWPAWTRRVPRPGPWMQRLQQLLAFPMYGAAAWLVWVLSQQTAPEGLAAALAGMVLLALAAWLYGQPGGGARLRLGLSTLAVLGALGLAGLTGGETARGDAHAGEWSAARVAALRDGGRPVLVNFTAAWCITCKVNERVALSTAAVTEAMAAKRVAYLKGDWTRQDADIAAELARHGRSGVPLYLLYAPADPSPTVLPALLTEGIVLDAIADL